MKTMVLGGAGFIGSEFCRQSYHDLIVVDKLTYAGSIDRLQDVKMDFEKVDIYNINELEVLFMHYKPDYVINFAAETHVDRSIKDDLPFVRTNIIGTLNTIKLCLKYDVKRYIHVSTDEVYGQSVTGAFKETDRLMPRNPYSATKASAELLVRSYIETFGLPSIIVRPTNNYGYWQHQEKFIPKIINNALRDQKIPVYGEGKQIREWLHVSDCATAIGIILLLGRIGEVYNIGSDFELENIETVKQVLRIMGKPESLISFVEDRKGHDFRYTIDSTKIKSLGWMPLVKFEDGINKTVQFYKEQYDKI